ncbi:hypothetical protein PV328_012351, partial [Microctonus aethiopoides]
AFTFFSSAATKSSMLFRTVLVRFHTVLQIQRVRGARSYYCTTFLDGFLIPESPPGAHSYYSVAFPDNTSWLFLWYGWRGPGFFVLLYGSTTTLLFRSLLF